MLPIRGRSHTRVLSWLVGLGLLVPVVPVLGQDEVTKSENSEAITARAIDRGIHLNKTESAAYIGAIAAPVKPASTGAVGFNLTPAEYDVLQIEFSSVLARRNFRMAGVSVFSSVDRFADAMVVPGSLAESVLLALPAGVIRVEAARPVNVPPPPPLRAVTPTRAAPSRIVRGGLSERGVDGAGVIIAIIDTGLDFRRSDFITRDSQGYDLSRLLYFWNLGDPGYQLRSLGTAPPLRYPNGAWAGTVYDRKQLTGLLRQPGGMMRDPDAQGHGTGAASVAAGNGRTSRERGYFDSKYVGVAPGADIIGVSIGSNLEYGGLLPAVLDWLDAVAKKENKPLVISCSFGGHGSGHNGTSVEELEIAARFPASTPGRAILFSAGNEGDFHMHGQVRLGNLLSPARVKWTIRQPLPADDGPCRQWQCSALQIFVPITANLSRANITATGLGATKVLALIAKPYDPDAREASYILKVVDTSTPLNTSNTPPDRYREGRVEVSLRTDSWIGVTVDLYAVTPSDLDPSIRVNGYQVASPGNAAAVITVGSYVWNGTFEAEDPRFNNLVVSGCALRIVPEELSCYSNPGYRRTTPLSTFPATVKPDFAAPGEIYYAIYAKLLNGRGAELGEELPIAKSGDYVYFNGTSASAPYAAGVVALMLQKNPRLTAGRIKQILQENVTREPLRMGQLPNQKWGYGKLDYEAALRVVDAAGSPTQLRLGSKTSPGLKWGNPVNLPKK